MTQLDDLLRCSADAPMPPAGFVRHILQRVLDAQERRGLKRLLGTSFLATVLLLLFFDLSSRVTVEFLGGKWHELLGGFYEEPALLLSREGWMALSEHFFHGSLPLLGVTVVLLLVMLRLLLRTYFSLPSRLHVSH